VATQHNGLTAAAAAGCVLCRFLPTIEGSVRQYLQDYQQHITSIPQDPAAAVGAAASAKAAAGADTTAQQMDTAEEADTAEPVVHVQATLAATVAGVTPGRKPFGALHANTQAAAATTVFAVKVPVKPAQCISKGAISEGVPGHPVDSSNCGNLENTAEPYHGGALLAGTQQEQTTSLAARTSCQSTRSKAGAGAAAASAAAAAVTTSTGFAVVPGHVGHVGLFGAAAAMSSPAPGFTGMTPTRLMR
jgi:hypothetical protein